MVEVHPEEAECTSGYDVEQSWGYRSRDSRRVSGNRAYTKPVCQLSVAELGAATRQNFFVSPSVTGPGADTVGSGTPHTFNKEQARARNLAVAKRALLLLDGMRAADLLSVLRKMAAKNVRDEALLWKLPDRLVLCLAELTPSELVEVVELYFADFGVPHEQLLAMVVATLELDLPGKSISSKSDPSKPEETSLAHAASDAGQRIGAPAKNHPGLPTSGRTGVGQLKAPLFLH